MKTPMFPAIIALAAMSHAATIAPEEKGQVVRSVKWSDVPLPPGATLQNKPGTSPTLLVKHDGSKALQLPLWKLTAPGITKKCYALRGKVRYKDVTGIGYFELWNEFPASAAGQPNPRYFSRSLAEQGPFARITGSSDWREMFIPFDASQSPQVPVALELNLSLPGAGEVEVTSLVLIEFDDAKAMWGAMVTEAASPPNIQWTGKVANVALAVGGLVTAALIVWAVSRKGRHTAEARRMRAIDTLP